MGDIGSSVPVFEQYTRPTDNARAPFAWIINGGRREDDGERIRWYGGDEVGEKLASLARCQN